LLLDLTSRKRFNAAVQRRTDGRAVFVRRRDIEPLQVLQQEIVVERQWPGDIRLGGKGDQPDAVVWAFGDELLQHVFGDREAVRALAAKFKIL